jgi:hypothetical protein
MTLDPYRRAKRYPRFILDELGEVDQIDSLHRT